MAAAIAGVLLLATGIVLTLRSAPQSAAPQVATSQVATSQVATEKSWQTPRASSQSDAAAERRGVVAIAVLPFNNHGEPSGASSQIAEMMTDDLINMVARIPVFRVISNQTASTLRGQSVDPAAVGAEFGVRYVLEGSVAVSGTGLRVNTELVDTRTRLHIWSGRFERAVGAQAAIQDEIVQSLGRELQLEIEQVESEPTSSDPDLHELVFKGIRATNAARRRGMPAIQEAEALFRRVLERDPGNLRATIGLAGMYALIAVQMISDDTPGHIAKGEALLQPVLERFPNIDGPHFVLAMLRIAAYRNTEAVALMERAIEINPSNAPAHAQLGRVLMRMGRAQEGLDHARYAMQLSPRDPIMPVWYGICGFGELELGHFDSSIHYLEQALAANPTQARNLQTLIAAQALSGRLDDARQTLARLQQVHPHLTNAYLVKQHSKPDPQLMTNKGIRRAIAYVEGMN
jgi:TolB-like protein